MVSSPSHGGIEKKYWWLTNKKIVDMYVKDARSLIASQDQSNIASAVNLLDAALALSPKFEIAMELKAASLLHLRRFNEVADMLQDYIPSLKLSSDDSSASSSSSSSASSSSSDNISQSLARERVKLLSAGDSSSDRSEQSFKCFSVSDLKKRVIASFVKNREKEGQWRYLILGQACCHLGLMEDAMALLQTGKRLASAAFRRESICWSDDSFTSSGETLTFTTTTNHPQTPPPTDSESICHLLSHIKLLLRRKTAAIAAMEAGLYTESIRHFSKIVDGRRSAPPPFLADCYLRRASAYHSSGRLAEAIADCNRTLALDPSSIEALTTRASVYKSINCLTDSLHDLEHLKLLYNSFLRDRRLPGPPWKPQTIRYHEIPGKLCSISTQIQQLKQRVASGEISNINYHALMGLRRGCSRSDLERSYLLLTLRHKPDKSTNFIDRCEFSDERDVDSVKDRAKMSSLSLYRLIQRGYTKLVKTVADEEACEKQRKKASASASASASAALLQQAIKHDEHVVQQSSKSRVQVEKKNAFQGVFCRDLAVVGNLLSQTGFNRPIQVKYEGLSC